MSDFPNIFRTKVVPAELDTYWEEYQPASPVSAATTLVVSQPFDEGSAEQVQLQKILLACKLTDGQYHVVQLPPAQLLAWHKLRDTFNPDVVLLFGILPEQLGISAMFRLFFPNRFNDKIWVASPALPELETQPEAKKQLWQNGLKPVFDELNQGKAG